MSRVIWGLLLCVAVKPGLAATDARAAAVKDVGFQDVLQWGLALLFVLGIFGVFVWMFRKLSGLPIGGAAKLRMLGGLSLGMREKIVLLEVGKKQLVLGVTPGRIETLLVLEGEDRLIRDDDGRGGSNLFSQKLMQAMKGLGNG